MKSILSKLLPSRITYRHTHHPSTEERFWSKVDKDGNSPCWMWTSSKNKKGYGTFSLSKVKYQAHRVSWELVHGEIPDDMLVLHTCDNPPCVNPHHLFIGDNTDNMRDMVAKGRNKNPSARMKGESHPNSKLSDVGVSEIKNLYSSGEYTYYDLAKMYNVSYQLIGMIITEKRRKH